MDCDVNQTKEFRCNWTRGNRQFWSGRYLRMRNTTRVGRKATATARSGIDPRKYGRLLSRALPGVIETEEENEAMLAAAERLLEKGKTA
jgi:hypothetical protein